MAPSARDRQVVDTPLGRIFSSPKKRNRHATRSSRETVIPFGRDVRLNELQSNLQSLLESSNNSKIANKGQTSGHMPNGQLCGEPGERLADDNKDAAGDREHMAGAEDTSEDLCDSGMPENVTKRCRVVADLKATQLYARWQALLCDLEAPYLDYMAASTRLPTGVTFSPTKTGCGSDGCNTVAHTVLMLFWDRESLCCCS